MLLLWMRPILPQPKHMQEQRLQGLQHLVPLSSSAQNKDRPDPIPHSSHSEDRVEPGQPRREPKES